MAGTNKNTRRHQLARMGASRVWVKRNPLPYAVRKIMLKKQKRSMAK